MKYVNVPTISFSKNPDILFSSLWCAMWICSGSCTLCTFGFSSVLGKTWFLVRFVLAQFCFCPISNRDILVILAINAGLDRTKRCTEKLFTTRNPDTDPFDHYLHVTWRIFRLDALALSVIATATWLGGWLAGCLSHSGIVSKRLNLSENFFDHLKAPSF